MLNYNITLDTHKMGTQAVINSKEFDAFSRTIEIMLTENGIPLEFNPNEVEFMAYLQWGEEFPLSQSCDYTTKENTILLTIPKAACNIAGDVHCELRCSKIVDNEVVETFATPRFRIKVENSIPYLESREITDNIDGITDAVGKVNSFAQTFAISVPESMISTETGEAGSDADVDVSIIKSGYNYKLGFDFTIPRGEQGIPGTPGEDAKINGVNTLNIVEGENITLEQDGDTLTISAQGGTDVEEVPYEYFEPIQVSGVNWEANTIGYSLSSTTGRPASTGNTKRAISPFIEVKPGERYIRATGFATCTYDENQNLVEYSYDKSTHSATFNEEIYEFVVPSNVKYVRLDYHTIDGGTNYREYDGLWKVSPNDTEFANKLKNDIALQEKISPFYNKTIVCFGDSITGNFRFPIGYPSIIANTLRCKVYNVGFGGCRMSEPTDTWYANFCMEHLADAVADEDFTDQVDAWDNRSGRGAVQYQYSIDALNDINWSKVDYITIAYGTNDFHTPLTTITDALEYSIQTILTAHPHIKPIVLTPIYRKWTDGDADTKVSLEGYTLVEMANAIKVKCAEMHIPCIDLMNTLGINKYNYAHYLNNESNEYVHPNTNGLQLMGSTISGGLLGMATMPSVDISKKMEYCELIYNSGSGTIYRATDSTHTSLTFAEIKTLIENPTLFVFANHQGRLFVPTVGSNVIYFDSSNIGDDGLRSYRIMVRADSSVRYDAITTANINNVYTKAEIDAKIGDIESLLSEV